MSRRAKRPMVDHRATAAALRNLPGVWLPVGDYRNGATADAVARAIQAGRQIGPRSIPYTPAGAFEARLEFVEDGTRIHARYIGEEATR